MAITADHRELLRAAAITDEVIEASGIRSTPKGLQFPWSDGNGPVQWQSRPDVPLLDDEGEPMKYLFPSGARMAFNRLRDGDGYERMILAEGTKQQYAVLSHAPKDTAVYGLSGCWAWNDADFSPAREREVFLLFDGDLETNPGVYGAAEELTKQLKRSGAKSVKYVLTTARGKDGVDDVLAAMPEGDRAFMLKLWLSQASDRMPKRPKKKRNDRKGANPEQFFYQSDKPLKLAVEDATNDLLSRHPAAVTRENTVAMYTNGFYQVNSNAFIAAVSDMFGNLYTPAIRANLEEFSRGHLYRSGLELPERSPYRLLNCTNGMLDLLTGELLPHDPKYLSCVQIPVAWEPDAECPVYEAWLSQACGDQVEDLEEVAATVLDPTRTPTKAIFLFGPSKSGKSTFLRILKALVGHRNTSAVTLHQIADDRFAAANIYGKMLNVAADLSSKHVDDLSVFKMLTGEDEVSANRKYGAQFTFTNQALFAFSANELPTVSESSRAYSERIKPFEFPNSFAGREDLGLETKLMDELPGILVRWVAAWRRFHQRGGYQRTADAVREQFEAKSDRVVQFVTDMCDITGAKEGARLEAHQCTGRRDVAFAFNAWAKRNGGTEMGERKIFERLRNIQGIAEVRGLKGARAFNVVVRSADEDRWEDEQESAAEVVNLWAVEDAAVPQEPVQQLSEVPGMEAVGIVVDRVAEQMLRTEAVQQMAVGLNLPKEIADLIPAPVIADRCSTPACDTGPGEPCSKHEREWAHAEDDHELCDHPSLSADGPSLPADGPSLHFGSDDRYRDSFRS